MQEVRGLYVLTIIEIMIAMIAVSVECLQFFFVVVNFYSNHNNSYNHCTNFIIGLSCYLIGIYILHYSEAPTTTEYRGSGWKTCTGSIT